MRDVFYDYDDVGDQRLRHSYTQKMSATTRLQAELQAVEKNYLTRSDLPMIREITERTNGKSPRPLAWNTSFGPANDYRNLS